MIVHFSLKDESPDSLWSQESRLKTAAAQQSNCVFWAAILPDLKKLILSYTHSFFSLLNNMKNVIIVSPYILYTRFFIWFNY